MIFDLVCHDFFRKLWLYVSLLGDIVYIINDSTKNGRPGHTGLYISYAGVSLFLDLDVELLNERNFTLQLIMHCLNISIQV